MPNHVMNRVTGPKDLIDSILRNGDDGKSCVDFGLVIPRPEVVPRVDAPSHIEIAAEVALGVERVHPYPHRDSWLPKNFNDDDFAMFLTFLRSYRETGAMNSLAWNRANWGTKWNAYDTERTSDRVVEFQTAWNAPHPVIAKLAEQSGVAFVHEWADEDYGHNVGRTVGQSGHVDSKDLGGTSEGWELCFDLWPGVREDYEFVDGEYRFREGSDSQTVCDDSGASPLGS